MVDAAALAADQVEPCPGIAATVQVDGTARAWGDCDGEGVLGDALKLIGAVADVPYEAEAGCPQSGEVVNVEG